MIRGLFAKTGKSRRGDNTGAMLNYNIPKRASQGRIRRKTHLFCKSTGQDGQNAGLISAAAPSSVAGFAVVTLQSGQGVRSPSLRLGQNPAPLRGPWAFALAPVQAPSLTAFQRFPKGHQPFFFGFSCLSAELYAAQNALVWSPAGCAGAAPLIPASSRSRAFLAFLLPLSAAWR